MGLNLKQTPKELVLPQKENLRHEYSENIFNGIDSVSKKPSIDNRFKLELVTRDVFEELELCGDAEGNYIFHFEEKFISKIRNDNSRLPLRSFIFQKLCQQ